MTQTTQIKVIPVAGRIGAEVQGVKLSSELEPAVLNEIKQALNEYKVLFFRGQSHLDDASHEAFARTLGEPYAHPFIQSKENTNYIFELDSKKMGASADVWHTDVTFVPEVPRFSILRGVTIPKAGGDTVWANTNTAYEELPEELKKLADSLWAVHSASDNQYHVNKKKKNSPKVDLKQEPTAISDTRHPVVFVHEETGKKHLLLGVFVKHFEGLSKSESEQLIQIFQSYITRLENTVRWKWTEGDVVIWDNIATQHYAIGDYGDQHRVVRRITVGKSVPVNLQNEASSFVVNE